MKSSIVSEPVSLNKSASDAWRKVCSQTTAHGLTNSNTAQGLIKRCIWLLANLICGGLMLWYMSSVFRLYFSYKVDIQQTRINLRQMVFPAVTVCNMNPIRASALEALPVSSRKKRDTTAESLSHDANKDIMLPNTVKSRSKRTATLSTCSGAGDALYHADSGMCFGLFSTTNTFRQTYAINKCTSLNAGLAIINTQSKWQFVKDNIPDQLGLGYWLYITTLRWVAQIDLPSFAFSAWDTGQPDTTQACVSALLASDSTGHLWRTTDCTALYLPLCQNVVACPNPIYDDGVDTFCYFLVAADLHTSTFSKSFRFCERLDPDAKLAVIDTEAKKNHIQSLGLFDRLDPSLVDPHYWIYIYKELGEDFFLWEKLYNLTYTNWASGYPTGVGRCVEADITTHEWVNVPCYDTTLNNIIVCQVQGVPYEPVSSSATTSEPDNNGATTIMTESNSEPAATDSNDIDPTTTDSSAIDATTTPQNPEAITTESVLDTGTTETLSSETTQEEQFETTCSDTMSSTSAAAPSSPNSVITNPTTSTTSNAQTSSTTTKIPLQATTLPDPAAVPSQSPVPGSAFPERIQTREIFQQQEQVTRYVSDLPIEEKRKLGYSANEFLLDCRYLGYKCSPEQDFSTFYSPIHGNCYTFNSGWNATKNIRKSYKTGRRYGLHVIVNVGQYEYTDTLGESAGARVVVHAQEHMPFPEDEGLVARPGQLTSVGVRKLSILRLPYPYGNCTDPSVKNFTRSVYEETYDEKIEYSKMACFKTCYQRYVIDLCDCADPYYPRYGEAFGHAQVMACDTTNITQDDCKYGVEKRFINNDLDCYCPSSCSDDVYMTSSSTVQWPSDTQVNVTLANYKDKIASILSSSDPLYYKDNLLKVEIYYEEFNFERIKERPKYQWYHLIGDVGGILGLFLGFSVMTAVEFLELFVDVLLLCALKLVSLCRKCEQKQQHGNKGEFLKNNVGIGRYFKDGDALNGKKGHDTDVGLAMFVNDADNEIITSQAPPVSFMMRNREERITPVEMYRRFSVTEPVKL